MKDLRAAQFETFIAKGVAVVEFWEEWCKPCEAMKEVFKDLNTKAKLGRVEIAQNRELASKYTILSIPTIVIYVKGKEKERLTGVVPKEVLMEEIKNARNKY